MQKLIFTLFSLFFISKIASATEIRTPSEIKSVTVYRSGARLTNEARVTLPAGRSEVVFENLSPFFNANSLQVRLAGGGASLLSAIFRVRNLDENIVSSETRPRFVSLRDSIVLFGDKLAALADEREVFQNESILISKKSDEMGIPASGEKPVFEVVDLEKLAQFYNRRQLEIKKSLRKLELDERDLRKQLKKMNEGLQKIQSNYLASTGEIVLRLDAPTGQTLQISCIYLVNEAGWSPLYDLRCEGLDKSLRIISKANVVNRTGFDWKNVKLSLSSALPFSNNDRPILYPVFVDFRVVNIYAGNQNEIYQQKKDLGRAQEYNLQSQQNIASIPGQSSIDGADVLTPGSRDADGNDENATNFDIVALQDIASDGKENTILMTEQDAPAEYWYHSVPKIDPSVYLIAKVPDFGRYNLLRGTANIFFGENFVGQTNINPNVASDTLLLSLGRDDQITIKRVKPKDFTERKKIFGQTVKETYLYEITVVNNKSLAVKIEILDQLPISKQKDIEVELLESDGAKYTAAFGKLEWETDVAPGKVRKIRFSYSMKYPKGREVSVLKN